MTATPLADVLAEAVERYGRYDVADGAFGHESPNRDYFHTARAITKALRDGTDPQDAVYTMLLPAFLSWFADRCEYVWRDPDLARRMRFVIAAYLTP